MKTIFKLLPLLTLPLLASCEEEKNNKPGGYDAPFALITATDGPNATVSATVDDNARTIHFDFGERQEAEAIPVTFQLNDGYTLVDPATTQATLDLTAPRTVVVARGSQEMEYTLSAACIDPSFVPPFETVTAAFRNTTLEASFDHAKRKIRLMFPLYASEYPKVSLREVPVTLAVSDAYTQVSPSAETLTLDLSREDNEVIVRNRETEEELSYTFEAQIFPRPIQDRTETFEFHRGVNLSYWIQYYNPVWTGYFTVNTAELIKSYGFDHFRIPLDEYAIFDKNFNWVPEWLSAIRTILDWCEANGIRAILDRHIMRPIATGSDEFNERDLYRNPEARELFIQTWCKLSETFKDYDPDIVAYELLNEPHDGTDDGSAWAELQDEIIGRIRITEPERIFFTPSMNYQDYMTVKHARIQENDPNVIISFHYYLPMLFTHRGLSNSIWSKYKGDVQYPGSVIPTREDAAANPDFSSYFGMIYNAARLAGELSIPATDGRFMGRKVHCGEFGCMNDVPHAMRVAWFRDMVAALEANGIPWTQWECNGGGFGFWGSSGPDWEILQILTGYQKP